MQLLIENAVKHNKFTIDKPLKIELISDENSLIVVNNLNIRSDVENSTKLGLDNFEDLYSQAVQNDLFDRLENGSIPPDTFRKELRRYVKINVSDKIIDDAWNSMLLDIPLERIRVLERLKSKYQTFLLGSQVSAISAIGVWGVNYFRVFSTKSPILLDHFLKQRSLMQLLPYLKHDLDHNPYL